MAFTIVFNGEVEKLPFNPLKYDTPYGSPNAISRGDALSDLDEAKAWLEACLELVESGVPPNWDGIQQFLART